METQLSQFAQENVCSFAVGNVAKEKDNTSFTLLEDYFKEQVLSLTDKQQSLFEWYIGFTGCKNATIAMQYCLENLAEGKEINFEHVLDNQSKLTTKNAVSASNFSEFMGLYVEEPNAIDIANQYMSSQGINVLPFDYFMVDNGTISKGDYVRGTDMTFGETLYTKVVQVSPNGFITAVEQGGVFTLSNFCGYVPVPAETVPERTRKVVDKLYDSLLPALEEDKSTFIERFDKKQKLAEERAAKLAEKAASKAAMEAEKQLKVEKVNSRVNEVIVMDIYSENHLAEVIGIINSEKLAAKLPDWYREALKKAKTLTRQQVKLAKDKTEADGKVAEAKEALKQAPAEEKDAITKLLEKAKAKQAQIGDAIKAIKNELTNLKEVVVATLANAEEQQEGITA